MWCVFVWTQALTPQEQMHADRQRELASRRARHEDLDLASLTGSEMNEDEKQSLMDALSVGEAKIHPGPPRTELEKIFQSMTLRSFGKVTHKRIYSMLYHPTQDKDLVFTGDQEGVLGVWTPFASSEASNGDADNADDAPTLPEGAAFQLQVHGRSSVACMRLDPAHHDRLYSSSYDASVRLFSLGVNTSVEVWAGDGDVQLGAFDILAPLTQAKDATPTPAPQLDERSLWLADHRGGLIHLDVREGSKATARRWQASEKKVRAALRRRSPQIGGMSVNATLPHCVATASNDRYVRLFDVRMMQNVAETSVAPPKMSHDDIASVEALQNKAVFGTHDYKAACTSTDFSPDGRHLVSVCYDDTLSLWDFDRSALHAEGCKREDDTKPRFGGLYSWLTPAGDSPTKGGRRTSVKKEDGADGTTVNMLEKPRRIPHNNQTGKWVTLFRATWNKNPQLEPHFSIGSMTRHAEIYSGSGRLLASLYDPDWVTAIPAVTAMHPLTPGRLATGNGSGKCALWAPPDE